MLMAQSPHRCGPEKGRRKMNTTRKVMRAMNMTQKVMCNANNAFEVDATTQVKADGSIASLTCHGLEKADVKQTRLQKRYADGHQHQRG